MMKRKFVAIYGDPTPEELAATEAATKAAADEATAKAATDEAAAKVAADAAAAAAEAARKAAAFSPEQQTKVNSLLAAEKRKHQAEKEAFVAQLQELQTAKLSGDELGVQLQARLEALEVSKMTEKEKAAHDLAKATKETEAKIKALETTVTEKDAAITKWQSMFSDFKVETDILRSAVENKAFAPEQFVPILKPLTKLKEVKGTNGESTGEFETTILFQTAEGAKETLTVDGAIKAMQLNPEKYGNLFSTEARGGVGATAPVQTTGGNTGKGPSMKELKNMPMDEYIKRRAEGTL